MMRALVLFLFAATASFAQTTTTTWCALDGSNCAFQPSTDKPPVIAMRLSSQELAELAVVQRQVNDAEKSLEMATQAASLVKYEIDKRYRTKSIPNATCTSAFIGTWGDSYDPPFKHTELNPARSSVGYTSEIENGWIIFTLGEAPCKVTGW